MPFTTPIDESHPRRAAADAAIAAPPDDDEVRVMKVGTFATGQSEAGEYVVATDAPVGSFAAGHPTPDEGATTAD